MCVDDDDAAWTTAFGTVPAGLSEMAEGVPELFRTVVPASDGTEPEGSAGAAVLGRSAS